LRFFSGIITWAVIFAIFLLEMALAIMFYDKSKISPSSGFSDVNSA